MKLKQAIVVLKFNDVVEVKLISVRVHNVNLHDDGEIAVIAMPGDKWHSLCITNGMFSCANVAHLSFVC